MKTTYWKGNNLGPNRMEFMRKNLRLKQIELPTEEEIHKQCEAEHSNSGGLVDSASKGGFKMGANWVLSKLKGDEKPT